MRPSCSTTLLRDFLYLHNFFLQMFDLRA